MTPRPSAASATATLRLEARKLARSPVARVASGAVLVLTLVTTVGGYAAGTLVPGTELGRKAAAMIAAPGWPGFMGLAALSVGVTTPARRGRRHVLGGRARVHRRDDRGALRHPAAPHHRRGGQGRRGVVDAVLLVTGGVALGLSPSGGVGSALAIATSASLLGASALPVMWVATRWRGYLAGIAATLGIVVVTNVAAGFGMGGYLPWAIPVLWATPGTDTSASLLVLPVAVGVLGHGRSAARGAGFNSGTPDRRARRPTVRARGERRPADPRRSELEPQKSSFSARSVRRSGSAGPEVTTSSRPGLGVRDPYPG